MVKGSEQGPGLNNHVLPQLCSDGVGKAQASIIRGTHL